MAPIANSSSNTSASNGTVYTSTTQTSSGTSGGTTVTGVSNTGTTTTTVQPLNVSPSSPGVYTPAGSPTTVTTQPTGIGGAYLSTNQYSAYGFYGELAPLAITPSSKFYFRSSQQIMNLEVAGAVNSYVGSQAALVANYVDANNYIAASASINNRSWEEGDITVLLRVMRDGIPRVLNVSLGKSRQRAGDSPLKYLSLTVLPEFARFDGLWPITISYWTADSGANRAVSFTGYDPDVGTGKYFDTNLGTVGTGYNLPAYDAGVTYSVSIRDVTFGSYDPIRTGIFEYSIFTDPDEPNPPIVALSLQGATMSVPYTAEQITEVTYEVSSSTDDSSWEDWSELATLQIAAGGSGTYIHRSTLNTRYYRYRARYTYINSEGKVIKTPPSDYVVLGAGVLTPAGIADGLPKGVTIPVQKTSKSEPGGANPEGLRWTNSTDSSIIATDYAQQSGVAGTTTALTTRGFELYHPATPLYAKASLQLNSTNAESSIRVKVGNTDKILVDSKGNTELGTALGRVVFFS